MSSSRKWAKSISSIASRLYFLLIIFQVPLFRVSCRSGICINPVQVTSSQLIASEMLPVSFVKILLYPGSIVNAVINGILAGSYFCVFGAILGLLKYNRLSLFGMLLLIWGLIKEIMNQKSSCSVQVSPFMLLVALFTALSSIKSDVRIIIRSFQAHYSATAAAEMHEHVKKRKKDREMKRLEWNVNYVNNNAKTTRSTKVAQEGITNSTFY
ncbi:uncharacterized protein [Spinacia oleracea]|uniref:Uncharacterized protein isoform X2 n=1 Tax=Spinacia oleracea TaxID=3562 RepID=A0ABM3QH45_SPIOL|nr:uncharacterized protein LOC110792927 isoform X2 [Spinacia oleracea]